MDLIAFHSHCCGAEYHKFFDFVCGEPVLCQNSALLKDHGCNLMHRNVLALFYQHLMAEAPPGLQQAGADG